MSVYSNQSVVAIIPAKLTSIRLPKKNIADLGGYPLLYYSIRVAQLCPSISEIYVTSESEVIIELAHKYGVKAIKRPRELSMPDVTNAKVLSHTLSFIADENGKQPELVILLQPTHPFRFPEEIEEGIQTFKEDDSADMLLTVVPDNSLIGEIKNNRFVPEYALPRNKKKTSDKFVNTGSFYIYRVLRTLAKEKIFAENILPFRLNHPEFEIDIDYPRDLMHARFIMETYRSKFSYFWSGCI